MFAISRRRTECDDFIYSCEECGSESHSVASLNHEINCSVNNPDYKYGNIGLTNEGIPVVLDYGTRPDYKEK